ncbi:TPA: YkgJ family cysteine cluster protein [Vibrio parahaemolyticus]|nr:YkgJ family cysteine cluster protein [Vibrio parahaemolyticus]
MLIPTNTPSSSNVSCSNCKACCCRLEVMIISDTGVPEEFIARMMRLNDGWCAALDRDTLMCTIYENRPWICREFEMASNECLDERVKFI